MDSPPPDETFPAAVTAQTSRFTRAYQAYIDKLVPFTAYRWAGTGVLLLAFMVRIFIAQGWYIVCYTLGIYLLNLFLAFLTPKFDPSLEQDDEMEGGGQQTSLPTSKDEEFRPFIRRLPEFKFWHNSTRAIILSIFATLFNACDIPVFWPILVIYWFILFTLTMRRQIQHMMKYRYVPFTFGKARYTRS